MQKLLKRSAQVHRQVARRQRVAREKNASDTRKLLIQQQSAVIKARREIQVSARRAYKEDWVLGPLAPRRDVGDKAETYGTVPLRSTQTVDKMEGEWKKWGIRAGDRVCVVGERERDRGKIGVVREIMEKAETCRVVGINMVNVPTPEYMKTSERQEIPVQTIAAPIPLSSVRLVIPLYDPSTGITRDVIVKELFLKGGQRFIANYIVPGEQSRLHCIPWPEKEKPANVEDHDDDTFRIDVEQVTWVPTLLRAPMPEGVIDELRYKYSKFRTRHEDWYIEKKKSQDETLQKKEEELKWGGGTPKEMLTPVQELNRMRRMEREGLERNKVAEEVLAGIGEVMAGKGKSLAPGAMEEQEAKAERDMESIFFEEDWESRVDSQAPHRFNSKHRRRKEAKSSLARQ
ncbi:MAG: hypothetical protein L6R37_002772 [Teloschistes peruensis]|nr:MAG: hypothetical protein L6R37_002772 [Teloschistes peruensis]